jgi:POT family proton-dependent oligopeptide transporter
MMGAFFLGTGISQYLGSVVANFAQIPENLTDPLQSLPIYTGLFTRLGLVACVGVALAVALLPIMQRLSTTHRAAPAAAAGLGTVAGEE